MGCRLENGGALETNLQSLEPQLLFRQVAQALADHQPRNARPPGQKSQRSQA